jgi:hypothetical protein
MSLSFPLRDRFFPPALLDFSDSDTESEWHWAENRVTAMSPVGVQLASIY